MLRRLKEFFIDFPIFFIKGMRLLFQLMYGSWKVLKLKEPRVTFFGGSRIRLEDIYAESAHLLAHKLAENNISVITGGGPGIMEAANCGAAEVGKKLNKFTSMGIGIKDLPNEKRINSCAQDKIVFDNFFVRKWLLVNYSNGFVVFPGGYGTLDELGAILTLIETKKSPRVPVVLFGKEFWKDFINWLTDSALKEGTVTKEEINLILITDDVDEAFCLLRDQCQLIKKKKGI